MPIYFELKFGCYKKIDIIIVVTSRNCTYLRFSSHMPLIMAYLHSARPLYQPSRYTYIRGDSMHNVSCLDLKNHALYIHAFVLFWYSGTIVFVLFVVPFLHNTDGDHPIGLHTPMQRLSNSLKFHRENQVHLGVIGATYWKLVNDPDFYLC